jgi:hypothetical protein
VDPHSLYANSNQAQTHLFLVCGVLEALARSLSSPPPCLPDPELPVRSTVELQRRLLQLLASVDTPPHRLTKGGTPEADRSVVRGPKPDRGAIPYVEDSEPRDRAASFEEYCRWAVSDAAAHVMRFSRRAVPVSADVDAGFAGAGAGGPSPGEGKVICALDFTLHHARGLVEQGLSEITQQRMNGYLGERADDTEDMLFKMRKLIVDVQHSGTQSTGISPHLDIVYEVRGAHVKLGSERL